MKAALLFIKRLGLVISMLLGAGFYLLYINIDALRSTHALAGKIIRISQPSLLFMMLLLTFLKVKPSDLQLRKWQIGGLLLQGCTWIMGTLILATIPMSQVWRLGAEGFLLCMICPTATAAAVVTGKLGGNQGSLTMYTILVNLMVSLLIPFMIPLIYQQGDATFWTTFLQIILKIFPLLFFPFVCAILIRRFMPGIAEVLIGIPNAAFYLWMISLSLAISVSAKNMHQSFMSGDGIWPQAAIATGSLIACIIQFSAGKWMGTHIGCYPGNEEISASQGLGQKNTVFAIWCGYTFMDPLSSIAGGFYSIWHNVYNSYQLTKKK
ncbi:MAG: transporter [Bacteroidaceae bacterium]|nr:transporter [Bacteroidaceae bacterium]